MGHGRDSQRGSTLMDAGHLEVYRQLQAFEIDEPDVHFSFAQRLARDSRWSLAYTHQVIDEYKKFLFLAIAADHTVVPPDAVDEAWHLHLTYTHSYWNNLCGQLLKKPMHHWPSRRGSRQQAFFRECYQKTLRSYEAFFGYAPPASIWQSADSRFGQSGQFRRINLREYWLIPKPAFHWSQFLSLHRWNQARLLAIALTVLALGLVVGWHFLHQPAIAFRWDRMADLSTLSAVDQSPVLDAPTQPDEKSFQIPWCFILMGMIVLLILYGVVENLRCPNCKRLAMTTIQTIVINAPTSKSTGKRRVIRRCSNCQHREEKIETIPDTGCACGC